MNTEMAKNCFWMNCDKDKKSLTMVKASSKKELKQITDGKSVTTEFTSAYEISEIKLPSKMSQHFSVNI